MTEPEIEEGKETKDLILLFYSHVCANFLYSRASQFHISVQKVTKTSIQCVNRETVHSNGVLIAH